MSSEIATTTGEIPTSTSSGAKQVAAISPNGTLNPNAAVFDSFSLMTLDKSSEPETSLQYSPEDTLQYSPEVVNGYGPYGSPGIVTDVMPDISSPDKLPHDDLKTLLQHQLEYYFSRENLSRDTYLVSQMDKDNYVPIWTVANFNQVKKLTKDLELVKQVLRESPHLQVDPLCEKVRANVKRCIVVLREIPESTPLEEVEKLFSGEGCPKPTGCEFVNNDYWYIQFDSEDSAQKAYRYLREEVKTFKGKPIMARIKAKPIHQSNFVPKNTSRLSPSQTQAPQPGVVETSMPPPTPPQATMFNQRHFQFPPVQPMFNGQQPFPYYPAPGMMTWPPGQAVYREPHMSPGFPNNGFGHGPMKPSREMPGSNAVRHGYQVNRTRFQNKPHHRDQTSSDRSDRDTGNRTRPQSANGTSSHNTLNTTPTTSSPSNSTSAGAVSTSSSTRDNTVAKSTGSFRTKDSRESEELSRRTGRPIRRRRGSSEDIRRDTRQKENRASPVRHSKDDSDTLDLAPSHFPPLPTSPLAATKQQSVLLAKDFPEIKPAKPQTVDKVDKAPVSPVSPAPPPTKQESPPAPKPVEKMPKPVEKPKELPVKREPKPQPAPQEESPTAPSNPPRPAERLSYAQMAAQKGPKPASNPPANVQNKSPGK